MPYVLSGIIRKDTVGQWGEGAPYEVQSIYSLNSNDPKAPPVNYDAHILKPHSLTHMEAPSHILEGGLTVSDYFTADRIAAFYGPVAVLRLKDPKWKAVVGTPLFQYLVTREDLESQLSRLNVRTPPNKLILTADISRAGTELESHDPSYALTLDENAAEWLISNPGFNLYGTSWKSTDFQPGSRSRPIHRIIFRQAVIMECLELTGVPEGEYFLSAFPLPLDGASESPVCPVLYGKGEMELTSQAED